MADKKKAKKEESINLEGEETKDLLQEETQAQKPDLAAELEALQDKYLRVCAEYDNFRKRTQKDRESLFTVAIADVIASFLPIIDNMERACMAEEADEGVKMIMKQILQLLEKYGVRALGQPDEEFNPKFHEAVSHEDRDGTGESRILDVLQKGYILGDRLIRPAMVRTVS